jgi:peptidoglycan-N-acetylglucosamine deacetylase
VKALVAALFASILSGGGPALSGPAPELAVTFDDLPVHGPLPPGVDRLQVAQAIIAALKSAGLPPVYGFVNGAHLSDGADAAAVLPAWRAAGFPLGNHTWSHLNLNGRTAEEFEREVAENEPVLEQAMAGGDWRWLRYPYLAEGDTPEKRAEVRRFLGRRGYRIAGVTMSFGDYAFNDPYARCMARGDNAALARLETAYLDAAAAEVRRARVMSKAAFGRDIPYVLLMHIGAMDARMLPRLLALYRSEGFSFVTLPQAERDPFYAPDVQPAGLDGPDTLAAALAARGQPAPTAGDLGWLDGVCR